MKSEMSIANEEARNAAAKWLDENRYTFISAPKQAYEGLIGWDTCPGVTNVRVSSSTLPALDGHKETATDGSEVAFEPIFKGSTVLVAGTGGQKTRQTLNFLQQGLKTELGLPVCHKDESRSPINAGLAMCHCFRTHQSFTQNRIRYQSPRDEPLSQLPVSGRQNDGVDQAHTRYHIHRADR